MRISIWQQWASNHSAGFTVVGEFKSEEAANQAADTLRGILVTVAEWYERPENADLRAQWEEGEALPPSPPEIDFSKQYGVEWNEQSIDWIRSRSMAGEAVSVLDNRVFVSSVIEETWLGPKPFDVLMEKLGGQVQVTGEGGGARLIVAVSCIAPDENTARSVYDQCSTYLSNPQFQPMPWQSYADEHLVSLNTGEATEVSREDQTKVQNLYKAISQSQRDLMRRFKTDPQLLALQAKMQEAGQQPDRQHVNELLLEYYQRVMQDLLGAPAMQEALRAIDPANMARYVANSSGMITTFGFAAQEGSISRDGLRLEFKDVVFANVQHGLLALVEYLKGKGCTEVKYVLQPHEWGE